MSSQVQRVSRPLPNVSQVVGSEPSSQMSMQAESLSFFEPADKDDFDALAEPGIPLQFMNRRLMGPSISGSSHEGQSVRSIAGTDFDQLPFEGLNVYRSMNSTLPSSVVGANPYAYTPAENVYSTAAFHASDHGPWAAATQDNDGARDTVRPSSHKGRWLACGAITAVVIGAATGVGIYFGKIKPDQAAAGSSLGASIGSPSSVSSRLSPSSATSALGYTGPSSAVQTPSFSSTGFSTSAVSTLSSSLVSFTTSSVISSSPSVTNAVSTPVVSTTTASTSLASQPSSNATAGVLANGVYGITSTKTSDDCNFMNIACNDVLTESWTVSTSGSSYLILSGFDGKSVDAGTPTSDNQLTFPMATDIMPGPNGCSLAYTRAYGLTLQAQSFSGKSLWRRTLTQNCTTNQGVNLLSGQFCECAYDVVGS